MASFTLTAFPAGTAVGVYLRSNFPAVPLVPQGAPVGSQAASGTVASDGTVTFTGLADGTAYVAHATIDSADRYVSFRTQLPASGGSGSSTTVQINPQTGPYTVVAGDAGKVITVDSAAPASVTVPPASTLAPPAGMVFTVAQLGAGTVTVAAGAGVTIITPVGYSTAIADQRGQVSLIYLGSDAWLAGGNLAPA